MASATSFTVQGHGPFPFDMLRFDECYPVDSESVAAIALDVTEMRAGDSSRRVRLISTRRFGPTPKRWESFGWRLIKPNEKD